MLNAQRKPTNLRLIGLVAVAGLTVSSVAVGAAAAALSANGADLKEGGRDDRASVAQAATPPADEASPFHISGPNAEPENLARSAGLDDLPPETSLANVRAVDPSFRLLASADQERFTLTAAESRRNAKGFAWITYYKDDVQRQLLSVGSWSKVGEFNLVVPLNSPVTNFDLTTIDGLPALTMLPSARVVGGLGPRTAFLYLAGVIYVVHGDGFFSDDSFFSVVHNFTAEVKG